ncbi:L-histidine N(alpha)-methyltransferase [Actinoplanes sp. CA-142083]|uniref:L-histidine N(alpha)-methyltransferase n=1 Tax=Actinoplanes sp. CA-142083 TaxID=3239903 RepID=UPI003D8C6D78
MIHSPRGATDATRRPFFERPDHRDAVVRGIRAGVLPLKFAYAGSAAHTHDRLAHGEGYQSVIGAVSHVREALHSAELDDLSRIAELGPGNGVNSLALLRQLKDIERFPGRFLGLDFSATLLDIAADNFEREMPDVRFAGAVWDAEAGPTDAIRDWREDEPGPIPLLFLGNTIGNLEDPVATVRNLLASMSTEDTLVIGATLRGSGDMTKPYENEVFRAAALEPLIACGIDTRLLEFRVEYRDHRVVGTATLLGPVGEGLEAGHEVRCFMSRRFSAAEIEQIIDEAGGERGITSADASADHLVVTARRR